MTIDASVRQHAGARRTAASLGLLVCRACRLISQPHSSYGTPAGAPPLRLRCPRCGSLLRWRKPDSIARTWAFLVAALALYVPANVLPIMQTASLFGYERDTILSGILFLWKSGSWPLAIIVFIASFLVPLAKIAALSYLLVSVQRKSARAMRERAALYRVVEFIGRWSMLDIFVMTLLVALVQIRTLAQIRAEPGAVAFGGVVVMTMLAALSFDPRLIWDAAPQETHGD